MTLSHACVVPWMLVQDALDDEQELRRQRAEEAAKLREQRMKEAYDELKHSDKAKDMKEQVRGSGIAVVWVGRSSKRGRWGQPLRWAGGGCMGGLDGPSGKKRNCEGELQSHMSAGGQVMRLALDTHMLFCLLFHRPQEMLRLQMQAAYKAGDLATAERIMKRLAPGACTLAHIWEQSH